MARQLSILCVHGISHGNIPLGLDDFRNKINDHATATGIVDHLHRLMIDRNTSDARELFHSGLGTQLPIYVPAGKQFRNLCSLLT